MKNKGVVVEIAPKNRIIVLTAQGEFVRVPFKKHVYVGQEIRLKKRESPMIWRLGLTAALVLALVGTWPLIAEKYLALTSQPEFFVTVDLDSSLELQVDGGQRVTAVEGLNREGLELVPRLRVVGQDLRSALEHLARQALQEGYLGTAQNPVTVTVASSGDWDGKLTSGGSGEYEKLEQAIAEAFNAAQLAQVRIWQVPLELQKEAKAAGITPSRYLALNMPWQRVMGQRLEARLTVPPDRPEQPKRYSALGTFPARPSLAPLQWTGSNSAADKNSDVYKLSLPVVAQAKGDFRFYE